jgi:sugar lactone lactonase YvrE
MKQFATEILHSPESAALRYLPEGPQIVSDDVISWVAIQHGSDSQVGSLNLLNVQTGDTTQFALPGRPGFAFPLAADGKFLIGLERHVGVFDSNKTADNWQPVTEELEQGVSNTIINDGEPFAGGVVFGTKDLEFNDPKAGLYLWRSTDSSCVKLRGDQTCSNGKVITADGNEVTVFDIDTPTKTIVRFTLDVANGTATAWETLIDLRDGDDFPDGMVATPDGNSIIVAFYNPNDGEYGVARQFSLATGEVEAIWTTEKSPRVTCPLLMEIDGQVKLILTTADEGMSSEQQEQHVNAGRLFIGDTEFDSLPTPHRLDLERIIH